jgi:predicted RNA methylase
LYFEEYSKNDIHKIMCSDNIRVAAYKDALALLAKGKSVLDIGSGTGVLSFAAVEAGASRVYAVEKADIYRSCNKEIKKRGLESKVKVMNCRAEEAPLEGIKNDILVSEWMGYFLLFERMLPSVLNVRDKFLDEAGILIPGHARIYIAAIARNKVYQIQAI